MTKNAKDPELARNFLTFMIGPEFQSIIPTTNWMMPVTATKEPLPEAFGKLVDPQKTFLIPPGGRRQPQGLDRRMAGRHEPELRPDCPAQRKAG